MRRIATRQRFGSLQFIPGLCALLAVAAVGAIGKADARKPVSLITTPATTPRMVYQWPAPVKAQIIQALPHARAVLMEVTAYCPCSKCCGKDAHG